MRVTAWSPTRPGQRAVVLVAAMVVGAGVSACGGAGGDPVQGAQIPRVVATSDSGQSGAGADGTGSDSAGDSAGSDSVGSDSAGDSGGSGASGDGSQSGSGGSAGTGTTSGTGGSGGRKTGLPKSIRLPEIDSTTFRTDVLAACGSLTRNPSCLSVKITTVIDDSRVPGLCSIDWTSEPPKTSDPNDPSRSFVQRGSTITATETCPAPDSSAGSTDSATTSATSTEDTGNTEDGGSGDGGNGDTGDGGNSGDGGNGGDGGSE